MATQMATRRSRDPEAKPEKLKRGFKGPKVPRKEDRQTGFGIDDKDTNPLAHLGLPAIEDDQGSQGTSLTNKAQLRVQEELKQLQRQLNNAAKEDNAVGISQCVQLQDTLDLQLLGPAGTLDLGTALCLTARRGNLQALTALLEHGANTEHESDDHRMRPLHLAVSHDEKMAARALIEARADLHAPSDSGVPLVLAVNKGASASVWELLRVDRCDKENTDPDGPVPVGKMLPPSDAQVSAFHTAVLRGDIPIVRQFVKAGMPIDALNHSGWAAIHVACRDHRDGALVKLLAGAACKLNTAERTTGMTPLVIAAKQGYVGIVTQLLDIGVELDEGDNNGVTALQSACRQGRFDITSLLLEQGASTTRRTKAGDTALTTAVKANFQDIVSRLLRHPGVDAEAVQQFWLHREVMWSPMQIAARDGFMSVCEVLWKQGKADVNRQLRDEAGLTWTTLGIAASRNHLDVCKLLLRGRARVYPTNEDGRQAVWFAARDGYSAVTVALLEGGGNASQADVDGLTPALAAALYGHADTIMRVLKWQVAERRELAEAEERQKLDKEDAGEEIDVYDEGGEESDDSFDAALQHEQMQKRSSAELDVMTVTADDLLPGALGPSAFAGLGLVLRSAVLREDLDLLELALRLGADPESEDDQHRKCPVSSIPDNTQLLLCSFEIVLLRHGFVFHAGAGSVGGRAGSSAWPDRCAVAGGPDGGIDLPPGTTADTS
jgi:ankyrin repeat protein